MFNRKEVHISTGFLTLNREDVDLLDPYKSIDKQVRESIEKEIPEGASLIRKLQDVKYQNDEWSVMYTIYYV